MYNKGRKSSTHKYHIKTSNHKRTRVQVQDIWNVFEIKRSATEKEKKKKTVEINSWLPVVKEEAEVGG